MKIEVVRFMGYLVGDKSLLYSLSPRFNLLIIYIFYEI